MVPFFQGKIDNFCAVYAVLNAMKLICNISSLQARNLFADLLLRHSRNEANFRAILYHTTDYNDLVDDFFLQLLKQFPVKVTAPFPDEAAAPSEDDIWNILKDYAKPDEGRSAVFRFCRFAPLAAHPVADHWTTAQRVEGETLHFFDCSLEKMGLYALPRHLLRVQAHIRPLEYVQVPPRSIRLVERCSEHEARKRMNSWLY